MTPIPFHTMSTRIRRISGALLLALLAFATTASAATSMQAYVDAMQPGTNLGNTLDAVPTETSWGNPPTTQAMIQHIAALGFKSIRIPVTWMDQIGQNDIWPSDQTYRDAFTATGEFPFADGSKDAALVATLKPGVYTAEADDASGGECIAIVEVYEYP